MRFLLPGLPGLAVCAALAWPSTLLWLMAAFQMFTALNFTNGWIAPVNIPLPVVSFTLFPSDPPKNEDWRIAEILREAEKRADPAAPLANLTLIGNAPRLNGPNFTWMTKELDLKKIRIRGVNHRLCEFSQFVVLKEGELGPRTVISGLPEAAQTVREKGGWFSKGYAEAARFPLPDGSGAVLFAQRKLTAPQFKQGKLSFQFYENGAMRATNMKVDLGAFDAPSGTYPKASLSADNVTIRGLSVTRPSVEFHDLALVSASKDARAEWDDVRMLKLGRLVVRSAQVTAADLKALLEERVKNLKVDRLELEAGEIRIAGSFSNIALSAVAKPTLEPDGLRIRLLDARLGVTALPAALLGPSREFFVPFTPNPETPFWIVVPSLTIDKGVLKIGS